MLGGRHLSGRFENSKFLLSVTGDIFSVAEVADQVAWVGAALRSSPLAPSGAYSVAHLHVLEMFEEFVTARASIHGRCEIKFRMERLSEADVAHQPGSCWRDMFQEPVIVTGYPILRRPMEEAGLETSLQIVAALTNCRRVTNIAGKAFLKGVSAMLAAVRVVDGVLLWHFLGNPEGGSISYEDPRLPADCQAVTTDDVGLCRHIVGWTDSVRNFAGKKGRSQPPAIC